MRHRVRLVFDFEMAVVEARNVVDVTFRFFDDIRHRTHRFDGVLARRRFARQHNRARAVVNGVCNVRNFRAGGAGVLDHGFQHFGCGDNALSEKAAFRDEILLDGGYFGKRDFHAQIPAADHNAFALRTNILDIFNAAAVFDFCDYIDVFAAVFFQKGFKVDKVLLARHERRRNKTHAVFYAEKKVGFILLAKVNLAERFSREGHTFAV